MAHEFLKEFCTANTSVREFSKQKGLTEARTGKLIYKDFRELFYSRVINIYEYVKFPNSAIHKIKASRNELLLAIDAHDKALEEVVYNASNRKIGDLSIAEFASMMGLILSKKELY